MSIRLKIARFIMAPAGIVASIASIFSPENEERGEKLAIGIALIVIGLIWNVLHYRLSKGGKSTEGAEDWESTIADIPGLAETHRSKASTVLGHEIEYDEAGLESIDAFIDKAWPDGSPVLSDMVVQLIGSYLGECIRKIHGGEWGFVEDHGICLTDIGGKNIAVFPFSRVAKRLESTDAESVSVLYAQIKSAL